VCRWSAGARCSLPSRATPCEADCVEWRLRAYVPRRRAGVLRELVLHRYAGLSRACNGRPANQLKFLKFYSRLPN
jgi:hypothetical protein